MKIYPALDLLDGQCVRLSEGNFERKTIYSEDPQNIALHIHSLGAQYLHLVDLSGAKNPANRQLELIQKIISTTHLKVQCGGGIRSHQDVRNLLQIGTDRIVLGSVTITHPHLALSLLKEWGPDRLTFAMDLKINTQGQMQLASAGWQTTSDQDLNEWIETYLAAGLRRILCTDISRDGMMTGPNLELYQILMEKYPQIELQASGGVSALADLKALAAMGMHSVIFGKAFYEGRIPLPEALQLQKAPA